MKTLKSKERIKSDVMGDYHSFYYDDVKEALNNFYNEYWEISYIGDKYKKHITCDELDYLMNKHFGTLVKIETLQDLPNK